MMAFSYDTVAIVSLHPTHSGSPKSMSHSLSIACMNPLVFLCGLGGLEVGVSWIILKLFAYRSISYRIGCSAVQFQGNILPAIAPAAALMPYMTTTPVEYQHLHSLHLRELQNPKVLRWVARGEGYRVPATRNGANGFTVVFVNSYPFVASAWGPIDIQTGTGNFFPNKVIVTVVWGVKTGVVVELS